MVIAFILLFCAFCFASVYNPETAFQVSISETSGIAVEPHTGTVVVSGESKVTLVHYSNGSFETVRTDGPFRTLECVYEPFYRVIESIHAIWKRESKSRKIFREFGR